jgi:hypothetical protein
MPYVMDWPPKRVLAIALVGLAMLVAAPVASASSGSSTSCPIPPSSTVFAPLGDSANYSLVPGGDFEGSMAGWTLNNASVVNGNEPWYVGGSGDSQSLSVGPGGSAISPSICVSDLFPSLRFFALNAQNNGGTSGNSLRVTALWTDSNGNTHEFMLGRLSDSQFQSWEPTPSIALGSYLPDGMSVNVQLEFSSGANSTWQIDDVYVDPYAK